MLTLWRLGMLKGCFRGAFGAPKGALETSRGGPWAPLGAPGAPSEGSWGASGMSRGGFGELFRAPRTRRKLKSRKAGICNTSQAKTMFLRAQRLQSEAKMNMRERVLSMLEQKQASGEHAGS